MLNLASILRPESLQDFIAQEHILASNTPLFKMLKHNAVSHCFFYGPPGSGKTTLATLIAKELNKPFATYNATSFKIEELRQFVKSYENTLFQPIIFIDEVHRLTRTQQEVLLPIMESYSAIIIGASTYNPFHSLTNAIRSRSFIFELKPHSATHLDSILDKALTYLKDNRNMHIELESQARDYLISSSVGDARAMLNLLDAAISSGESTISLHTLKALRPYALHDGASESQSHYTLISALIKSIRGSDVNASVYYLARLIAANENPEFIARRLVILASEDIGNANPNALNLATSTMMAVSKIGYPESRIILSQCVIYLASSPKSNTAYNAINAALASIKQGCVLEVPKQILPDSSSYLYPHDFGGWVEQSYLTQDLDFIESTNKGFEKTLNEWLEKIKGISKNKGAENA
ncbi:replication-associated recombination protein A [Helicobacter labetoulli]|uniref:replication-associated recombination protein A n=1 Tax=Helicobacter labetoulli TaxID=2315333 RepID=UPI000EF72FF9|nr:replication-associated recombination protein A [Helicobacter labetoulli]